MTVRAFPSRRPASRPSVSIPGIPTAAFLRDFGVVLLVIGVYFLARGLAPTRTDLAFAVTDHLVAIEKGAGVFWELQVQEVSIRYHAVQEVANFTYAYLHLPVLASVGVWLWFRDRRAFIFMRNVMFVSMVIGVVFYYALPAAPPRLLALHEANMGFTDTVFGGNTAVHYGQPSFVQNNYAAIPSFHFGWIALAAAIVWVNTENRLARTLALALTILMTWAIVASANHLFIDMALGGLVVAVSWWTARRIERRFQQPVVSFRRSGDDRVVRAA